MSHNAIASPRIEGLDARSFDAVPLMRYFDAVRVRAFVMNYIKRAPPATVDAEAPVEAIRRELNVHASSCGVAFGEHLLAYWQTMHKVCDTSYLSRNARAIYRRKRPI